MVERSLKQRGGLIQRRVLYQKHDRLPDFFTEEALSGPDTVFDVTEEEIDGTLDIVFQEQG